MKMKDGKINSDMEVTLSTYLKFRINITLFTELRISNFNYLGNTKIKFLKIISLHLIVSHFNKKICINYLIRIFSQKF